jgi:hypothetical protein
MAAPLAVVAACLAATTTTKVEDVDGGPLGGCCRYFQQRPSPKLETSMAGPMGVLPVSLVPTTTEVGDVDGGPLGVLSVFLVAATTEVGAVDGGSDHH